MALLLRVAAQLDANEMIERPLLRGDWGRRAIEIARLIGERVSDPVEVQTLFATHPKRGLSGELVPWTAAGLADGTAGTSLLLSGLDKAFPGERWRPDSHAHLEAASRANHSSVGLFDGWAGLLAAARYASGDGPRYRQLMSSVERLIASWCVKREKGDGSPPLSTAEYDLISGAAGVMIAMGAKGNAEAQRALEEYACGLVAEDSGASWRAPFFVYDQRRKPTMVQANNLGIAHGLPGLLAAMCLQRSDDGARVAKLEMSRWIVNKGVNSAGGGLTWPSAVSGEKKYSSRTAWCYGTPGVSAALWLAGQQLADVHLQTTAVASLQGALRTNRAEWEIVDNCLCHGTAGLAQIAASIGLQASDSLLIEIAIELFVEIISAFDNKLPLGYQMMDSEGEWYDNPGLLDGAAGVALALLTAATDVDDTWVRYFALADSSALMLSAAEGYKKA